MIIDAAVGRQELVKVHLIDGIPAEEVASLVALAYKVSVICVIGVTIIARVAVVAHVIDALFIILQTICYIAIKIYRELSVIYSTHTSSFSPVAMTEIALLPRYVHKNGAGSGHLGGDKPTDVE